MTGSVLSRWALSSRNRERAYQVAYAPVAWWKWHDNARLAARMPGAVRRWLAVGMDEDMPGQVEALLHHLGTFSGVPDFDAAEVHRRAAEITFVSGSGDEVAPLGGSPTRIPAQWEPTESVVIGWPICFPPIWKSHAALARAVLDTGADAVVLAPSRAMAAVIDTMVSPSEASRTRYLERPTDDFWVRDCGPITGLTADGRRVMHASIYDPPPPMPNELDAQVPAALARAFGADLRRIDWHFEGGNLWTDGAGVHYLTDGVFERNRDLSRTEVFERLEGAFATDRIVILPRLRDEVTGHVDLVMKLVAADRALVPVGGLNEPVFSDARRQLEQRGIDVVPLPAVPRIWNFGSTVWPSHTNALTVNGHVLVPTYGLPTDEAALDAYTQAHAGKVVPIESGLLARAGGAVHCVTMQIPAVPDAV